MKPINSNVLIKIQIPDYKTTDSGIILGTVKSAVDDRETTGIVEAVGPEVKTLKPGYIMLLLENETFWDTLMLLVNKISSLGYYLIENISYLTVYLGSLF